MNSSPKRGRVLHTEYSVDDVFVLGKSARRAVDHPEAVVTATSLVTAAEARRQQAEQEAESLVAAANAEAEAIREAARQEGFAAGHEQGLAAGRETALSEVAGHLETIRRAAEEGRSIRDGIVEQSASVIARAAMLVVRRIVADYYEADPGRTAAAVDEARRAAATQQIVAIRVHPSVAASVQARLSDVAGLVVSDTAVEIGGCLVDLDHGTIDATLDSRISMMDLALQRAAGNGS